MTDIVRQTLPFALFTALAAASAPALATVARHSVRRPVASAAAKPTTPSAARPAALSCEGTAAYTVSNPWTGAQRSEGQITFNMALLPADRSVMIYHVAGTSVIKAGRHTLTVDTDGSLSTSWEWTDTNNRSQTVSLTVSRSGEFSGSWRSSSPLDQTPFGALVPVSIAGILYWT